MPAKVLRERIEGFLSSHRVCALATASADGGLVRNTPIEYEWYDGSF
ncbi:hypothetical protein [Olsenella porci]|uniref:Pyridoxamine 5'-phosphate oxidase family protein n=1 Tax=Olsenella porci TaxID=2652279 RepID=A0A6N7XDR8_9ACTN|nr:hypothetical protein [Olsenella porci]MST72453.1 pyridoxamine 5'-phosphate oxidase family protein [Olsenella porci]